MPSDGTEILEFNEYQKYDKVLFIIYEDFECIIEELDGCKNNSENSSTAKESKDIHSGFPMSRISSFRSIENKLDVYRGKDCMEYFYEFLREHVKSMINFRKKNNEIMNKRAAGIIWKCKTQKRKIWKQIFER